MISAALAYAAQAVRSSPLGGNKNPLAGCWFCRDISRGPGREACTRAVDSCHSFSGG